MNSSIYKNGQSHGVAGNVAQLPCFMCVLPNCTHVHAQARGGKAAPQLCMQHGQAAHFSTEDCNLRAHAFDDTGLHA